MIDNMAGLGGRQESDRSTVAHKERPGSSAHQQPLAHDVCRTIRIIIITINNKLKLIKRRPLFSVAKRFNRVKYQQRRNQRARRTALDVAQGCRFMEKTSR